MQTQHSIIAPKYFATIQAVDSTNKSPANQRRLIGQKRSTEAIHHNHNDKSGMGNQIRSTELTQAENINTALQTSFEDDPDRSPIF